MVMQFERLNSAKNRILELVRVVGANSQYTVNCEINIDSRFFYLDVWRDQQWQLMRKTGRHCLVSDFLTEITKLETALKNIIVEHGLDRQEVADIVAIPSAKTSGTVAQLHSNNVVDFAHITAMTFNIEDIAHSLSMQCRFNGHCREFYSVAQHSVLVSYLVPPEHALAALLHDAAEAYTGDVVTPLKQLLPVFKAISDQIERQLFTALGVKWPMSDIVKAADLQALATEARDLMPQNPVYWQSIAHIAPAEDEIIPLLPDTARALFLRRYFALQSQAINKAS